MALGGGCELILHCAKAVASLESYIGLVEVGVGLIPGAGGLKEGALRGAQAAQAAGMTDVFPFIKIWFLNAAMANVSKSALEAQQMGYLRATDTIVFNNHACCSTAIGVASRCTLPAIDRREAALLPLQDARVSRRSRRSWSICARRLHQPARFLSGVGIANVMCGGDVESTAQAAEQWLLDLERKFFTELVNHQVARANEE